MTIINDLTPGQKVQFKDSFEGSRDFEIGEIVTVATVEGHYVSIVEDTTGDLWNHEWFRNAPLQGIETISTTNGVIVVDGSASALVKRSYDYKQGDARRATQEAATEFAAVRAISRGVRQQVSRTSPALLGGDPMWLIQDIA